MLGLYLGFVDILSAEYFLFLWSYDVKKATKVTFGPPSYVAVIFLTG